MMDDIHVLDVVIGSLSDRKKIFDIMFNELDINPEWANRVLYHEAKMRFPVYVGEYEECLYVADTHFKDSDAVTVIMPVRPKKTKSS